MMPLPLDTPDGEQINAPAPVSNEPTYKVVGAAKIPVSKHLGSVWQSRYKSAQQKRQDLKLDVAWEEAVRYYHNDQYNQKLNSNKLSIPTRPLASRILLDYAEYENIIFANTNMAVAALYSKNPDVEVSTDDPTLEPIANMCEQLINALFSKKDTPGINLKPKVERWVVNAFLCNLGWLEVGWVHKEESNDQAIQELMELGQELENAKNTKEIEEIEGKLHALDLAVEFLTDAGPFVKWRPPGAILRDPMSVEEDLSDANYIIIDDFQSCALVKAKYYREDTDQTIYEPTHLMPVGKNVSAIEDEINNFTIFAKEKTYAEYGFDSEEAYDQAKIIHVAYVWDKVTRRVYLFNTKNWKWPIWVWNDPLGLTTFFPVVPLHFYTSPRGGESKGEVSYYIDQQDGINFANSLMHSIRAWNGTKFGYDNSNMTPVDAKKWLESKHQEITPFTVPEGKSLEDVFPRSIPHPATPHAQMIADTSLQRQAIDRMSVISEVLRGGQFKTNTTNDAVDFYKGVSGTRFDNLIDKIEEGIGEVGRLLLQLCLQFMDAEMVTSLIGPNGQQWQQLDKQTIRRFNVRIEGGSTQKPNSMGKKEEAKTVAQALGQFASVTPIAAVLAMKVMERAFDNVVITPEEWQMAYQPIIQQMQGGPEGQAPQGEQPLPPEAKQAYDEMVAQGVPPEVAQQRITEALQGTGNATA